MITYGFLGVGSIAEALVVGLCVAAEAPNVVLSPRSIARTQALTARYPSVRVAADNQAVVDAAHVVVVCLLPEHADDVIGPLSFRQDHVVVSAMAGVSMARLRALAAPATDVSRSVPLPAVATRNSITPLHPATLAATDLFDRLGGTMPVADEQAFESLSAASATVAAHFDHLRVVADWLAGHGIEDGQASRYVADLFAALAPEMRTPRVDFTALAAAHSTPGGLNEQFARHMEDAGAREMVRNGLDDVLARITPQQK